MGGNVAAGPHGLFVTSLLPFRNGLGVTNPMWHARRMDLSLGVRAKTTALFLRCQSRRLFVNVKFCGSVRGANDRLVPLACLA